MRKSAEESNRRFVFYDVLNAAEDAVAGDSMDHGMFPISESPLDDTKCILAF